jgi:NADH-quinone oxidoreductase subunit M
MIALLLLLIPLVTGLCSFGIRNEAAVKALALLASLVTLAVACWAATTQTPAALTYTAEWLPYLGASFSIGLDGMGKMLCLLTAISLPLVLVATWKNVYARPHAFYAWLLLMQCGLMGVFLSNDALLFYFAWELALIPAYFLCSGWGGEKRIAVTFKFFLYTFIGSLLMLVAILYLHYRTADESFSLQSFRSIALTTGEQYWLFGAFFTAFAIKMPVFPFHTWQPDTYEQSPTAATMMLSGVMVKMGLFGMIRWVLPLFPAAVDHFGHLVVWLSVVGIIYASLIAMRQDDMKRLIAYSSIAHIGLMNAAIFSRQDPGMDGVMIQMFNHGVNVIGLWIVVNAIETRFGTRRFSELGGIAQKAPGLTLLFVIMCLANVSLPLTNAFVGEFLMFNSLYRFSVAAAAVAGISIILVAAYTLTMIRKTFYGSTSPVTETAGGEATVGARLALVCIVILIIGLGVYPQPVIDLTKDVVNKLAAK